MATGEAVVPPPPPGFVLMGGDVPPPPPGFELVSEGPLPTPQAPKSAMGTILESPRWKTGIGGLIDVLRGAGKQAVYEGANVARAFQPPILRGPAPVRPEFKGAEPAGAFAVRAAPAAAAALATGGASLPAQAAIQALVAAAQAGVAEAKPAKETAVEAGLSAAAPFVPPVAKAALGKAAGGLKTWAANLYGKALAPTKEATKTLAGEVVPELIERRVAGSLKTIRARSETELSKFGAEIGAAYNAATKAGKKVDAVALAKGLEPLKVPFTEVAANGDVVILNPGAVSAIEGLQTTLKELGDSATPQAVFKFRRVIDDIVSASNGFTRELPQGTTKALQKQARAVFQAELNKAVPDVVALNSEYSFWKSAQRVVAETQRRRTGQEMNLIPTILGSAGAVATGTFGGGAPAAIAGGLAVQALTRVLRSPLYRTWSSVMKDALGDALAGKAAALATPAGKQVATQLALMGIRLSFGQPEKKGPQEAEETVEAPS